jgi:SAM-dependent methyltransferase
MPGYYSDKLSGERLRKVYAIAPPRIRQYLDAEIHFVLDVITPHDRVLELGCGYGRVLERLAEKAAFAVGIDASFDSLQSADNLTHRRSHIGLAQMDAARLGISGASFDCVVCIQNGISAFNVDKGRLMAEALRMTRPGGTVLFSSYAPQFWTERLAWFELQSRHGLVGEIDYAATGDGVIVCKDGFRAVTVGHDEFLRLTKKLNASASITEVDESSLFCVIRRD